MCEICYSVPCHPRCPNAPEPKTVFKCNCCDEPIVEGDDYYELDGEYYHEDCFEDNAVKILMEKCDATKGVAELEEEFYDDMY